MTLQQQIAKLSDADAERALKALVRQLADADPLLQDLIASPGDIAAAIQEVAKQTGETSFSEAVIKDRPAAIRAILEEAAKDPALAKRLKAWLADPRKLLIDPITTTLILAGVVAALSTHIKIQYENKGGKKHLKITVEKKPTAKSIIAKVLGFAKPGH